MANETQQILDNDSSESNWPNCRTPDCANKECLWLRRGLCYPCTVVHALRHQVMRNHEYKPDSCSPCDLAEMILNRAPHD